MRYTKVKNGKKETVLMGNKAINSTRRYDMGLESDRMRKLSYADLKEGQKVLVVFDMNYKKELPIVCEVVKETFFSAYSNGSESYKDLKHEGKYKYGVTIMLKERIKDGNILIFELPKR